MLVLGRYDDRGRDKVIEEDIRIGKSAKGEREENEQKEKISRSRKEKWRSGCALRSLPSNRLRRFRPSGYANERFIIASAQRHISTSESRPPTHSSFIAFVVVEYNRDTLLRARQVSEKKTAKRI